MKTKRLLTMGLLGWMLAAVAVIGFVACDNAKPTGKSQKKAAATDDEDAVEGEGEEGGAEEDPLALLMSQCGLDPNNTDPNAVVFQGSYRSVPMVVKKNTAIIKSLVSLGIPILGGLIPAEITVVVTALLNINSTAASGKTSLDFEIQANPALAKAAAESQVKKRRGTNTTKSVSVAERSAFMTDNKEWQGVVCTVQPTTEVYVGQGGKDTKVTFSPALPASVSPKAVAAKYAEEIPKELVFDNIKATWDGNTKTGRVTVRPVTPSLSVTVGTQTAQVTADVAYQIVANFGSNEDMEAIGVIPEQTFYIDTTNHKFKAIVAKTSSDPEIGTTVFVPVQ